MMNKEDTLGLLWRLILKKTKEVSPHGLKADNGGKGGMLEPDRMYSPKVFKRNKQ